MTSHAPRRRYVFDDTLTSTMRAKRDCAGLLKALRTVHGHPPADVAVSTRALPKFVPAAYEQSYCGSPGAMMAEVMGDVSGWRS